MRKSSSVISVIIMLLTVVFIAVPKPAAAFVPVPVVEPKVWEWHADGVTGEIIPMYTITTTPREWYQLKSDGIKVDGATHICHPFDEGRFGWTGEIFQLVEGAWVKLATTVGWVPTVEGKFKACAQAPAAGNYALFAYFDKAKAPVVVCEYDTSAWSVNIYGGEEVYFYARVDNIPADTLVTYRVIVPDPNLIVATNGSTISYGTVGFMYADFNEPLMWEEPWQVTLRISALGCSKDVVYTYNPVYD